LKIESLSIALMKDNISTFVKLSKTKFVAKVILNIVLISILGLFFMLLVQITLQYIPFDSDVAFLRIKQSYLSKPFYLSLFYVHVYSAIFSVLAGLTQFFKAFQVKYKFVHRYLGWFYVLIVLLLAAPSGFYIGIYANGGLSSQTSFVLLSILWFIFTALALYFALRKNYIQHKNFMIRSFALTLSAITLRAWKYLIVYWLHPKPMDVYVVVAWLGWVLNLLVAEIIIYKLNPKK